MKLLVEKNGDKPKVDTTAETASTRAFKRKHRLITTLESLRPRDVDDEMEFGVRIGVLVDTLTRYIGDPYITHLVQKVTNGKTKNFQADKKSRRQLIANAEDET
jgi:hypothetical protein